MQSTHLAMLLGVWRRYWLVVAVTLGVWSLSWLSNVQSDATAPLRGIVLVKLGGKPHEGFQIETIKGVEARLRQFQSHGLYLVTPYAEGVRDVVKIEFRDESGDIERITANLIRAATHLEESHKVLAARRFEESPFLALGYAPTERLGEPRIERGLRTGNWSGFQRASAAAAAAFCLAVLGVWRSRRKWYGGEWLVISIGAPVRVVWRGRRLVVAGVAIALVIALWVEVTRVGMLLGDARIGVYVGRVTVVMGGQAMPGSRFFPVETFEAVRGRLVALFGDRGLVRVDSVEARDGYTSRFRLEFQTEGTAPSARAELIRTMSEATRYIADRHARLLADWSGWRVPLRPPLLATSVAGEPEVFEGSRQIDVVRLALSGILAMGVSVVGLWLAAVGCATCRTPR